MNRAQQLLEHTEESIKVIAYSVGFSGSTTFFKSLQAVFS